MASSSFESNSIALQSATQMSQRMASGELSAEQILDAVLEQVRALNGVLNAIVTLDEAGARAQAQFADQARLRGESLGPLHGIPITIKDSFETDGLRTTSGFPALKTHVPEQDATLVARLKAAGAVIIGKTNLPLLAGDFQARNPIFGRSNNPWNIAHTTGGSTGGGAAAVAAGMSALELGSDLGGSIRQPAHYCGLACFKPGTTRISLVGHIPGSPAPGLSAGPSTLGFMAMPGILTRSARDLPLAMGVLAGSDNRWPDVPPLPLGESPPRPGLTGLRVAWTEAFPGVAVSEDTRTVLRQTAQSLQAAGCEVSECAPPELDYAAARKAWGEITGILMGSGLDRVTRNFFRLRVLMNDDRSDMKRGLVRGLGLKFSHYVRACVLRDEFIAQLEDFLCEWDVWLCPVSSGPAFTHRRTGKPIDIDGQRVEYLHACAGHTAMFNYSGNPVLVLPAGLSADSLPIGVQFVASRWGDERLLSLAPALEAVIGAARPPPLAVG